MMNAFRGSTQVEMGGKARVLKFGTNATALFCQMHKCGLGDFATMFSPSKISPAYYRDLIYCALVSGTKEAIDFTPQDVGDWIDDMPQDAFEGIFDTLAQSGPQSQGKAKP